jgi:hypothetical protein
LRQATKKQEAYLNGQDVTVMGIVSCTIEESCRPAESGTGNLPNVRKYLL